MDKHVEQNSYLIEGNRHQNYWIRKGDNFLFDSIEMGYEDLRLFPLPKDMDMQEKVKLIEHPALEEFKLTIQYQSGGHLEAVFRKSIMFKEGTAFPDEKHFITPYIDAIIDSSDGARKPNVVTIYIQESIDGGEKEVVALTSYLMGLNEQQLFHDEQTRKDYENVKDAFGEVCGHYLSIQKAMYDKPTIFTVASERPVRTYDKSSKSSSKKNHAKVVRTICINRDELEKQQHGHHEITCPCWGVVGHWRTYKKTGKRVWVAPYRKGKQRNNPDAYHPKDYEFVGGVSDDT